MSDFGVIFCGKCSSLLVDSGYETTSSLKCSECNNDKEFKVGKVTIPSNSSTSSDEIISQAKKDGRI